MTRKRIKRTTDDLVNRLRSHCDLLAEYHYRACQLGDAKFFGEIAGKLRVLVYSSRSNKPLLIGLMDELDLQIIAEFDTPAGIVEKTLSDYINELACAVRVPSGELVEITKSQYIAMWAQQTGASHEDWEVDEGLHTALHGGRLNINTLPISEYALCRICETILSYARDFLKAYEVSKATD